MARRRYISTDISLDERINQLAMEAGDFAVLLYTWMIPHAADDATIKGTPWRIMQMVVPGRRDKTEDDIAAALAAMDQLGLIQWDITAQVIRFPVAAFYRYQTYIRFEHRRAEDPAEVRQEASTTAELTEEQRKTPETAVSVSPSFSPSVSVSPSVSETEEPNVSSVSLARAAPKRRPTARSNPLWDAVAEICGSPVTRNERSDFGETISQLHEAGATPEQVAGFGPWWWKTYPEANLTHRCLRGHWGKYLTAPARPPQVTDLSPAMQAIVSYRREDNHDLQEYLRQQNGNAESLPPGEAGHAPRMVEAHGLLRPGLHQSQTGRG